MWNPNCSHTWRWLCRNSSYGGGPGRLTFSVTSLAKKLGDIWMLRPTKRERPWCAKPGRHDGAPDMARARPRLRHVGGKGPLGCCMYDKVLFAVYLMSRITRMCCRRISCMRPSLWCSYVIDKFLVKALADIYHQGKARTHSQAMANFKYEHLSI